MKKHLLLTMAATLALAGVVRADDAKPAAAPAAKAEAKPKAAAKAEAKPAADDAAVADASSDTKAAVIKPTPKNDAPGSLKGGNDLLDKGKYAEAASYFEGIGEQVDSNGKSKREPFRQLGLSTSYLELGKLAEAEAAATKATELKPELASAWNNLAGAQARDGKRTEAIATYNKGIEAVKAAKGDTAKLEANLAALQAAIEAGKPKKVREAEAKAKAEAEKAKAAADKAAAPAGDKAADKAAAPAADKAAAPAADKK